MNSILYKLFLGITLLWSFNSKSQSSFCWNFDGGKIWINDYIEHSNGNYYFCGSTVNLTPTYLKVMDTAFILCWNNKGDSITYSYKPQNVKGVIWHELIESRDKGLVAFGAVDYEHTIDTMDFIAVGYDSSMNREWVTRYKFARRDVVCRDIERMPNGNLLVSVHTGNYNWFSGTIDQNYLIEINEQGLITRMTSDTISDVFDIILHPDSSKIYCTGMFIDIPGISGLQSSITVFDTALNHLGQVPLIPKKIDYIGPSGIWINNDTLLFSAPKYMGSSNPTDICLFKMTDGDSLIAAKEVCYNYYDMDYTDNHSLTITKNNIIIQAGSLRNFDIIGILIAYDMNFNRLFCKLDNRQGIFETFYGNPYPTKDSGFIIRNAANNLLYGGNLSPFSIIKFDKNFNVTGIKKESGFSNIKCLLSPNPGTDFIQIDIFDYKHEKNNFELFTQTGQKMGRWEFAGDKAIINTEFLKPGMYFYRISNQNQIIDSGKWIKHIK